MNAKDPNENRPGYKETKVGWIPDDWQCSRLVEIAELESGHTPARDRDDYWNGNVGWVSLHDTENLDGREIKSTAQTVTEEGIKNSSARILPKGTVVFSRTATVGKATTLGLPMATSQDFANFVCGETLHNHYLVHLFRGMTLVWKRLMSGSTHKTVYMPEFKKLQIALPPIEEQLKATNILTTCDEAIEATGELIKAKQRQKKALMQQLLTGKKRLPGFEGEWKEKKLSALLEESREVGNLGGVAKKLTVKLYGRGVVEKRETQAGSDATRYYRRLAGQFIYSKLDFLNGAFGLVPPQLDGFESTLDLPAFDISDAVFSDWLLYYVIQENFYKRWFPLANGGRKARRINPSDFKHITIMVPSLEEQQAIAELLQCGENELHTLEAKLAALKQQKKALMQKLLTGQVRVKV